MTQRKAVPCKWCAQPTLMLGTGECDRCWALRTRIERDPALTARMLAALPPFQATKVKGFTLIEFMVVLVIVGLMLEMVLAGGSAIHAARVHDIVAQQEGLRAAFMGFQDRYRALPGDYADAPSALARAAGNGNGRIDPEEQTLAWVHLAAAGYTSTAAPTNVYGQSITVSFDNAYGDGHQAAHHNIKTGAGVPASVLWAADLKIDDGLPYSGSFQAISCADTANRVWSPDASDCAAATVLK